MSILFVLPLVMGDRLAPKSNFLSKNETSNIQMHSNSVKEE